METVPIEVPLGIRYLSEWTDFESMLPRGHIILNKAHTGVGATHYYLSNESKVILCSPRVSLIECKRSKHPDVWIYRDLSDNASSDSDGKSRSKSKKASFSKIQMYNKEVVQYIRRCCVNRKVPKLMTTYDSLEHIIDALNSMSASEIGTWTLVIDEFQAIFSDATYKSLTEMKLLANTSKFTRVIFLSATPFLEKYMKEIPEFNGLPYVELKWPPDMVEKANVINISIPKTKSRNDVCREIITKMKSGKTVRFGSKEIDTSEAVFYINSVVDIIRIIQKLNLCPDDVNILCSQSNEERIKKAGYTIGTIPGEGEHHKPFTFCTRSYFLGCDFNSECAYSYVFADPSRQTLALDISTDLSQILGRQRLNSNPYRNELIMFIREGSIGLEEEEFGRYIQNKKDKTERKIKTFQKLGPEEKLDQVGMIRSDVEKKHYSEDYLCIIDDRAPEVGFNMLYMLAEIRAWDIRRNNYSNQYSIIRQQQDAGVSVSIGTQSTNSEVLAFKSSFDAETHTDKRIKLYCEFRQNHPYLIDEIDFLSGKYTRYWDALGYEGMCKIGFQESKIKAILAAPTPFDDRAIIELRELMTEGKFYDNKEMKKLVGKAYEKAGIKRSPVAKDVEHLMTVTPRQTHKSGKRGYIINSVYQKNISFFPFAWLPNSHKEMTIDRFLEIIEKGNYNVTKGNIKRSIPEIINEIRGMTDKNAIGKSKKDWLPVACINGVFGSKHDHGLETYSSFVALDYDHFKDDTELENAKEDLKRFPFVYSIFQTPSGKGIKVIILHDSVNPENHYNLFYQLQKTCTLPQIDTCVSDISRGQFFSYDPDLWRNPNPVAFHFEYDTTIPQPPVKTEKNVIGEKGIATLDSWTSEFLHGLWENILTDDAVIARLDKHWHEKRTEYYQEGNRHSGLLIMAGTLCKAGIPIEKTMSYLIGSFPSMPEDEIDRIVKFSYDHNPFGCDRRKYK